MKLLRIPATLIAIGWGRHVATAPAIAHIAALQVQMRKMEKQFKNKGKSQAAEL